VLSQPEGLGGDQYLYWTWLRTLLMISKCHDSIPMHEIEPATVVLIVTIDGAVLSLVQCQPKLLAALLTRKSSPLVEIIMLQFH
jgi:hypothetical protein